MRLPQSSSESRQSAPEQVGATGAPTDLTVGPPGETTTWVEAWRARTRPCIVGRDGSDLDWPAGPGKVCGCEVTDMVVRRWTARATADGAQQYEAHFRGSVLPELASVDGHRGAYLLLDALGVNARHQCLCWRRSVASRRRASRARKYWMGSMKSSVTMRSSSTQLRSAPARPPPPPGGYRPRHARSGDTWSDSGSVQMPSSREG